MKPSDAGKGGSYRPYQKPRKITDLRYQLIYGSKKEKEIARKILKELGDIK